MEELRVGHGNGKNKASVVEYARGTRWDSFGFAEVEHLIAPLERIPDSKLVVIDADFDRAREAPILVSTRHRLEGHTAKRVSKALGRKGDELNRVAPARVLTVAYYDHPLAAELGAEGVAHINIHPPAGPKQLSGPDRDAQIVREYRKVWAAARRAWKSARAQGYLVVLTSDAQLPASSRRPWAPRAQALRLRARSWSTNIDWILIDRRLKFAGAPVTHQLFDHKGFIATLRRR